MEYGPLDYTQLPDLFDIEATTSPNGENVTLYINGTNRSDNVTVMCRDFRNAGFGQIETIFTLALEFISKPDCSTCKNLLAILSVDTMHVAH